MTKIHGLIWLAIGAVVVTASSYLGPKFKTFFWIGTLLVMYGVFKLIIRYTIGPQLSLESKPISTSPHLSRCHNCRASVYTTAKFCHMCGARLIHVSERSQTG